MLSVDYDMVGRTISQMSTPDEIGRMGVRDFCPGRRFNKGRRPGLADTTIKGGDEKWKKSRLPQTPSEKRLLIARLV